MTPQDWDKRTVGEICAFTNGHGFKVKEWSKSGLPIIRIQNLNGTSEFNFYSGAPEPSWVVETGELLYAWAGVPGVSFGPTIWNGPKGVLNQHIYRISPHTGIRKDWLFAVLQIVTAIIEKKAHGFKSSLLHVKKTDITGQRVFVPNEQEQAAICRTIANWDRGIDLTDRLIAEKRLRRKGLVQQLLTGKRRLPGFTGEWRTHKFGEFLTESRKQGSDGATARKLTIKLYAKGVLPKEEKTAGSESTQYFVRRKGQFIYSKLDFLNGAFGIIPDNLDGYESTLDLPAFDVESGLNVRWLFYFVSREEFYSQQLGLANGGRKARRVNPKAFLSCKVQMPEREEQDHIVAVLVFTDRELDLLQAKANALREQKKGLMQQLLTGKKRVKV